MILTNFDRYRNSLPNIYPASQYERRVITEPLLRDPIITKMIGLNMLTDKEKGNDLVGLMLAAGRRL